MIKPTSSGIGATPQPGLSSAAGRSTKGAESVVEQPVDRLAQQQEVFNSCQELEQLSPADLRKLAGVKKPGFLKRLGNTVTGWVSGVKLALAVGPTLGHTILAKELSQIEAKLTGKEPLAPLDWLRERRPEAYVSSVGTLLGALSTPVQSSFGLSLTDLLKVEQHFYEAMRPTELADGVKTTAPYLRELAKEPFRGPNDPRAAFVFLGEDLKEEAESVTSLWNSPDRPIENPFPSEDSRSIIWNRLEIEDGRGQLPVFVDVDGDYSTFTGTEFVAKRTLASLGERNNSLGDSFAEPGLYFAWLTARQESTSREFLPFLKAEDPTLSKQIEAFKEQLTPPWLDGTKGIGPWPAVEVVREIPQALSRIRESKGDAPWIDSMVAMDRDVLTGVQTHWVKMLREAPRAYREDLLGELPKALFEWNLRQPDAAGFDEVSPPGAPDLTELDCRGGPFVHKRPYDRSVALNEVVDHTLDGLGVAERRALLDEIKDLAKTETPTLKAREGRLLEGLGAAYQGLDVSAVLEGRVSSADLKVALKELRDFADKSPRDPLAQEARRHAHLLDFLHGMDHRYGEVDLIINRLSGDFENNPLGVSEYFTAPEAGTHVSALSAVPQTNVRVGNPNDPNPLKLSQVFEGGGGRGFAYVECLKQFEEAFANSEHGYEIDEFVGTSAGSLVAILLAAGFEPKEMLQVLETIDFKAFNADAVWMMGGVDPKVRGVDRTGLFTTQKMYQTFYGLLSEKLEIEGRPILFSDLPHKLKLVTTLLNGDLEPEDSLRENLDTDGRFTFSSEKTPNFDVVGALVSSAAVPGFFQTPQMLVARPENGELKRSRLQLCDGGVVDNLSLSSANRDEADRALVVLPAHTRARDPETGEWVSLDTLNFDTANLGVIDAHNRELYSTFMPQMDDYLQRMKTQGIGRAVLGFNLARPHEQSAPILQGSREELSLMSLIHAKDAGLPFMPKEKGDALVQKSQRPPTLLGKVAAGLFDSYVDDRPGDGNGKGDLSRVGDGYNFRPGGVEEADIFEIARGAGGAALSASASEYEARRFEQEN